MEKEELLKEKEEILSEITALREKLKEENDEINNLGGNLSFAKFFLTPLIIAGIITGIYKIGKFVDDSKIMGIFLIAFVVSFLVTSLKSKKALANKKEELVANRLETQKEIVKKSKKLKTLEERIKN